MTMKTTISNMPPEARSRGGKNKKLALKGKIPLPKIIWDARVMRIRLRQDDNGEWRIYSRDRKRGWTYLSTATDFEVSLWVELQAAWATIAELRRKTRKKK